MLMRCPINRCGRKGSINLTSKSHSKTLPLPWDEYDRHVGQPRQGLAHSRPDFLVISAPKTGTTWLYEGLTCHPEVFMPGKELQYFSSWWRWYDVNRLLQAYAGIKGHRRGDVGGSYALLPCPAIATISRILPDVRLVFIMRNPVDLVWSHLRHNFRFRVAGFTGYRGELAQVADPSYAELLWLDYHLAYADFEATLRRWVEFFPPDQFYLDFMDALDDGDSHLLTRVFSHVGADPKVDLANLPAGRRVMEGLTIPMPERLRKWLTRALARPVERLATYLRGMFGVSLPPAWQELLRVSAHGQGLPEDEPPTDVNLCAMLDRELRDGHLPRLFDQDYKGFNIIFHGGCFHGLACSSGQVDIHGCDQDRLRLLADQGLYLKGDSPEAVKRLIDEITRR